MLKYTHPILAKCIVAFCLFAIQTQRVLAQSISPSDQAKIDEGMAVGMRSEGKIYVVVAVLVTVMSGLFLYLINLDRKLSKLESNT